MGTVESELIELEKKYWQALKDRDAKTALALTDDGCILAGSSGVRQLDPATHEKVLRTDTWKLLDFELTDTKVRLLGEDVAIVAYAVKETMTLDGDPLELRATDTSTWVKRDGRWVCALHTESIAGDPFGRDRQPTA